MINTRKIITLLFTLILVLAMSACGTEKISETTSTDYLDSKTHEELEQMIGEIQEKENAILQAHAELWKTFSSAMDEHASTLELNENFNYGEYLLDGLKSVKDHFTAEEYALLQKDAEEILELEKQIQPLYEKYDSLEVSGSTVDPHTPLKAFPAFEGKDFDGNRVDNRLFSEHSVTVMNFWYTTCTACVNEFDVLEDLNKQLKDCNGVFVGVNAFTQNGDEQAISEAKEVLEKKGATFSNICFGSDSEAGKFTEQMSVFPATYVIDKNGNIVGEPIIGSLTTPEQMEKLQNLINVALEK